MKYLRNFKKYFKARSRSMLIKMFLSVIAVSLVVIFLLGMFSYYSISLNLDKRIEKNEQRQLNGTLKKIDLMFDEMQKLSMSFESNQKFTQFLFKPEKYFSTYYQDTQNDLAILVSLVNTSNYIKSLSIYYGNTGFILGSNGLLNMKLYPDLEWKKVYDTMTDRWQVMDTRFLPNTLNYSKTVNNYNVFTLITAIPYNYGIKQGAVVLYLDSGAVSNLLLGISDNINSKAFIVNSQGVIIASSSDEYMYRNISEFVDIPSGLLADNNGKFHYKSGEEKMTAFFSTSNINQWKLVLVSPDKILYDDSNRLKNTALFAILLLLLLSLAMAFIFSLKVYNPIKSVILNIRSMVNINDENSSDIKMIQSGMNLLFENNRNLEDQVIKNKTQMKEVFLGNLITGKLFNKNEIRNKAAYYQVDLTCKKYKVAVIDSNSMLSNSINIEEYEVKKVAIIDKITESFKNIGISVLNTQDPYDNILTLIKLDIDYDTLEAESLIEKTLEEILVSFEKYFELNVSIGVGRTQNDLANISVSYKEAIEALQYKFLKGEHSVINIRDINDKGEYKLFYPIEKEQKLISLVNSLDCDKVVACLNGMISDIMSQNKTFEHIEICLTNIIVLIQKCIYELKLDTDNMFNEKSSANVSIDEFLNIQQYTEWVNNKLINMIEYKINQNKSTNACFISEVKEYIENRYSEEITLHKIAKYFNYNPSYLSRIFKEKTGVSFWKYLSEFRIKMSKKLLLKTEKNIDEIASLTGYNSRDTFTRTFKKNTFLTPGEYRLKYMYSESSNIGS